MKDRPISVTACSLRFGGAAPPRSHHQLDLHVGQRSAVGGWLWIRLPGSLRILDAAGWPRGDNGKRFPIAFQAGQGRYLNDANVVQAIAQYLSDVGIDVDLQIMEWSSVYIPIIRKRNAGPLYFIGSGGALWSPLYDMTDLAAIDAGTNYTHWDDPRWFDRWADIAAATSAEETRTIVDEMLQVFYDDGPWLHLYFQPDFYGVSNRVDWQPRPDEKVYLFNAGLK